MNLNSDPSRLLGDGHARYERASYSADPPISGSALRLKSLATRLVIPVVDLPELDEGY